MGLNTAITFLRKDKKKPGIVNTEALHDTAEETVFIEEQTSAMYKAIAALSDIDKALVMLYMEDYSYNEIGSIMGISANNVAVKMNRIKTKLKDETKKHYQF